jgi:signal transduction histidine kinase
MTSRPPISLKRSFRRQAIRWALAGFVVTLFLAIPCVLYSAKVASERQLLVTAKSAARAFRPMILQDDIRDAEFQMRKALDLKTDESAIVRDPDLTAIYPLGESDKAVRCRAPNSYCWEPGFQSVSLLYPIYFDSQKPDVLYGYLELTMKPTLDLTVISIMVVLLLIAFIGQAFGLSSALDQSARQLAQQLSSWADHLRKSPGSRPANHLDAAPFTELQAMQDAVDGLYLEIEKLRLRTAKEAKTEAQFALLREISHDLKTPHSLLAKYFALHLDTVRTTGKSNPTEVTKVEATLKRMGELIRQVRVVPLGQSATSIGRMESNAACDLVAETRTVLEDLQHDPDASAKHVKIEGIYADGPMIEASVSRIAFYRVLENLARNAIEAVDAEAGHVTVSVKIIEGAPALVVRDNGGGIPPEAHDKILQFDFTTKPSRGTGLGLGIVDKICKEFGATLSFESAVGQGTMFTVIFESRSRMKAAVMIGEVPYVQV